MISSPGSPSRERAGAAARCASLDKTDDAGSVARYTQAALAPLPDSSGLGARPRRSKRADEPLMPITLLDIILLVVMLVSALLAMVRGFMREVLSIASWAAAAIVTGWAYPTLKPSPLQAVTNRICRLAA